MNDLLPLLMQYGYLVVFGVVLLENVGLPLPGAVALAVGGALAAGGKLSLPLVIGAGIAGVVIADHAWFALGRWLGRRALQALCHLTLYPDACVGATERIVLRHGTPSLLVVKFVPGVNSMVAPLLGILRVRPALFVGFDLGGALIFSVATTGLGYVLGVEAINAAHALLARVGTPLGWGVAGLVAGYVAWWLAVRLRMRRCSAPPD